MLQRTRLRTSFCRFCRSVVQQSRPSTLHTGTVYTKEESLRTYYQVLGVGRNANRTEIRAAFVTLSKRYHPDSNPRLKSESDTRAFVAVSEAYRVLSSPKKRDEYDHQLAVAEAYKESVYGGSGVWQARQPFPSDSYRTYSPGRGETDSQYYKHTDNDVDWELYRKSIRKPNHSRVLYMLLALTFTVPVIFMLRVNHNYHKYYQPAAILESQRNTAAYKAVREKAKNSSVQDQLDLLVSRRANRTSNKNDNPPI